MLILSEQEASDLRQYMGRIDAILSGAGLIANAPETVRITNQCKPTAKSRKKTLNRDTAIHLGKLLGRPDLVNYIKFN